MSWELRGEYIDSLVKDFSLEKLRRIFESKIKNYLEIKEERLDPEESKDFKEYSILKKFIAFKKTRRRYL